MMKCITLILFAALAAANSFARKVVVFKWPAVQPVSKSFNVPIAARADINLPILGLNGQPLYRFRCVPNMVGPNGAIDDLTCYLIPAKGPDDPDDFTLLTEDPSETRASHTRGEISAVDLQGACANYPQRGSDRTFRLRAMKLTLRIDDVKFASVPDVYNPADVLSEILAFKLNVTVVPDPSALSAIAEPVPFAQPKWKEADRLSNAVPDCSSIVYAHVPGRIGVHFVQREGLSGSFLPAIQWKKTVRLSAEKMQGYDFAFPEDPMPTKSRMVSLLVKAANGKTLYEFACSGYETAGGEVQGKILPRRFDRYGIVCGLFLPGKDLNLLSDGVDPYSRMNPAQIIPDQLYGACADYPDWGGKREFRLRGMKLSLDLSDPVFVKGDFADHALASVLLHIEIEPDESARSPVAAPPRTIYWGVLNGPHSCGTVLVAPNQLSSF